MKELNFSTDEKMEQAREYAHQVTRDKGKGDANYIYEAIIETNGPLCYVTTEDFNGQDVPREILRNVRTVKIHFYCGKLTVFFTTHSGKHHLITHENSTVLSFSRTSPVFAAPRGFLYVSVGANLLMDEQQGWGVLGVVTVTDECRKIDCGK